MRLNPRVAGQAAEWLLWTQLAVRSAGDLHVFLPTEDRGVDAYVRRRSTDAFVPVQVKARTAAAHDRLLVPVTESELADPSMRIVALELDVDAVQLHDWALLLDPDTVRQRGVHQAEERRWIIDPPIHPETGSSWYPYWTPLAELPQRLLPALAGRAQPIPDPATHADRDRIGYRGELAMMRALSDEPELNVFHAMPDYEMDEYVVRDVTTNSVLALQVKSISLGKGESWGLVRVATPTFRVSDRTWFIVIAEDRHSIEFFDDCLLIPSAALAELGAVHGTYRDFPFRPGPGRPTAVDRFRVPLASLGAAIRRVVAVAGSSSP